MYRKEAVPATSFSIFMLPRVLFSDAADNSHYIVIPEIFMGSKERPGRKSVNLTAICELIDYKICASLRFTTAWTSTACYWDSFILTQYLLRGTEETH
jgi:hypothetical protein